MRTLLAVVLAAIGGLIGGTLSIDAQWLVQAIWYVHATTVITFLPVYLLARSWRWLICAIPGVIAGGMMIGFRDDLVNRWPEVSRGPALAVLGAWSLGWRGWSPRREVIDSLKPADARWLASCDELPWSHQ